eukprot:12549751-Alexandrium_andersonii.AAC.1
MAVDDGDDDELREEIPPIDPRSVRRHRQTPGRWQRWQRAESLLLRPRGRGWCSLRWSRSPVAEA